MHKSLSNLENDFHGAKTLTLRGCNLWVVCVGKVSKSMPIAFVASTICGAMWLPWSSNINKFLFSHDKPPGIDATKSHNQFTNNSFVIYTFGCVGMHAPTSQLLM